MLVSESIISVLPPQTERIFIAYSGGIDSHVLLHLSSTITEIKSKITAVYVHHGLQEEASSWAKHCKSISFSLGVKFQSLQINAQKSARQSPEEVARDARYQVLKTLVGNNDILLLGQHRKDQLETVLLQLFRGAGVQGLSGMPGSAIFGQGIICRPFLDVSKEEIKVYAEDNGLRWTEDPSNKCNDFDRNFLRNKILPQLKQRWPAMDKTVARSARHCASSHKISQGLATTLLNTICDETDQTLIISKLLKLDINKQHLVIRQWLNNTQLRMPSEKMLESILGGVVGAKSGNPEVQGCGYSIRRYRDKLYCLKEKVESKIASNKNWLAGSNQLELDNGQQLILVECSEGILKTLWQNYKISVRFREGAEKIRLPGRKGHHALKKLFQEKAIPPWERDSIPLIYLNDSLAVVTGLWISADFYSVQKDECYQVSLSHGE